MSEETTEPTGAETDTLEDFYFQVTPIAGEEPADGTKLPSEKLPGVEEHGAREIYEKAKGFFKGAEPKDVLEDWSKQLAKMKALVSASAGSMLKDYPLESVSFALNFDVEMGVWGFAKVGAGATVQMTFTRKA